MHSGGVQVRRVRSLLQHLSCTAPTAAGAGAGGASRKPRPASHTTDDVRKAWGREAEARLIESGLEVVPGDAAENTRRLDEASRGGRARKATDMDGRHTEERIRYLEQVGAPLAVNSRTCSLLPSTVAELRDRELAAAARRDYRLATMIADTSSVFAPSPPLTLADCAPSTLEARFDFFLKHGFVVIHDVIPRDKLRACQTAWLRLEEPARAAFETSRADAEASGGSTIPMTFYSVDKLCDTEDAFIDIMDNPLTLPLMSMLCGHGGTVLENNQTDGVVRSNGGSGRVVPPDINPDGCEFGSQHSLPALAALLS